MKRDFSLYVYDNDEASCWITDEDLDYLGDVNINPLGPPSRRSKRIAGTKAPRIVDVSEFDINSHVVRLPTTVSKTHKTKEVKVARTLSSAESIGPLDLIIPPTPIEPLIKPPLPALFLHLPSDQEDSSSQEENFGGSKEENTVTSTPIKHIQESTYDPPNDQKEEIEEKTEESKQKTRTHYPVRSDLSLGYNDRDMLYRGSELIVFSSSPIRVLFPGSGKFSRYQHALDMYLSYQGQPKSDQLRIWNRICFGPTETFLSEESNLSVIDIMNFSSCCKALNGAFCFQYYMWWKPAFREGFSYVFYRGTGDMSNRWKYPKDAVRSGKFVFCLNCRKLRGYHKRIYRKCEINIRKFAKYNDIHSLATFSENPECKCTTMEFVEGAWKPAKFLESETKTLTLWRKENVC